MNPGFVFSGSLNKETGRRKYLRWNRDRFIKLKKKFFFFTFTPNRIFSNQINIYVRNSI